MLKSATNRHFGAIPLQKAVGENSQEWGSMETKCGSMLAVFTSFAAIGIGTPVAHADSTAYLNELSQKYKVFINVSTNQLMQLGYAACDAIKGGMTGAQRDYAVASYGTGKMGLPMVDEATAYNIASAAARNLC